MTDHSSAGTEEASATLLQRPAFIFALHTVEVAALDADGRLRLAALLAEAQSSLRVIGTCLATGQAAGLAATWYVRHGAPPGAADVRAEIETILGPAEERSG